MPKLDAYFQEEDNSAFFSEAATIPKQGTDFPQEVEKKKKVSINLGFRGTP